MVGLDLVELQGGGDEEGVPCSGRWVGLYRFETPLPLQSMLPDINVSLKTTLRDSRDFSNGKGFQGRI
jgi:hypothetical protein